jgi:hypothetical protein
MPSQDPAFSLSSIVSNHFIFAAALGTVLFGAYHVMGVVLKAKRDQFSALRAFLAAYGGVIGAHLIFVVLFKRPPSIADQEILPLVLAGLVIVSNSTSGVVRSFRELEGGSGKDSGDRERLKARVRELTVASSLFNQKHVLPVRELILSLTEGRFGRKDLRLCRALVLTVVRSSPGSPEARIIETFFEGFDP